MYKIKNKIRKIQILQLVVIGTYLLQKKKKFLPDKLYRYVCTLHGTAMQIRLVKTTNNN